MGNIISAVLSLLGLFIGKTDGGPAVPGPLMSILDKFAGVIAGVAAVAWFLGNRESVVSLNYLELAAVVLVMNLVLKLDPPKP